MTPGCFKSKAASSPRISTPLNSSANRRMSGPRPQFITPYRKQEAKRDVSPLARCSSSGIPVSESAEVQGSDVVEPSSKKARTSASNSRMDMKNGYHGLVSKVGKLILFFFPKSRIDKTLRFSVSFADDIRKFPTSSESCKFGHIRRGLDRCHVSNTVDSK